MSLLLRQEIFSNMGAWLYRVNNEGQMRWLGPEKGVMAMAVAGIVNSLWDLRGRIEEVKIFHKKKVKILPSEETCVETPD